MPGTGLCPLCGKTKDCQHLVTIFVGRIATEAWICDECRETLNSDPPKSRGLSRFKTLGDKSSAETKNK